MKDIDNRKNKSVSFSYDDPYEVQLLEHAEQKNPLTNRTRNFSKYVKRLIDEDMRGISRASAPVFFHEEPSHDDDTKEAMESFM